MPNPNKKLISKKIKQKWQDPTYRKKVLMGMRNKPPVSEETREKMSKSRTGKRKSDETKKKIAKALRGKRLSEDRKSKISKAHKKMWENGYERPLLERLKHSKLLSGSKNPNWRGGKTKGRHKAMSSIKYKEWRRNVFERDNYTCVICFQIGGKLNADHIKPWSTHPKLRYDIDNGRTLCLSCHRKTESYLNNKMGGVFL